MKVSARGCALALAGVAAPLWLAPPAFAATTSLPASSGGYFFAGGLPDSGTDAGKPPNLTANADGVSPGNLGVAGRGSREEKVSFLGFDLSALAEGTTVTKAVLSVPLTEPDPPRDVFMADSADRVRACAAGPEGFGGEDAESLTVAPERLCEDFEAPAQASADGTRYEFDITALAEQWVSGANDGVALTRVADAPDFQVVFKPFAEATLALETEEPAPTPVAPNTGADLGPIDTPTGGGADAGAGTTDLAGGFDAGTDAGAVFDTGVAEPPAVSPGIDLPAEPTVELVEQPAPALADDPQVAVTNVAAPGEAPLTPTAGFWLAGLALAGVLALLSLILGDPTVPQQTVGARRSRLDRALAEGRQGLGGGSRGPGRPALG